MASTDVVVFLKGRTEQFQASMGAAAGGVDRLDQNVSQKFQNIGKSIAGVGLKMTTYLTLPIAAAGVMAFKLASDLNESMNKVSVVFGGDAGGIKRWSKDAATAMGISQQQALESAGTFGNLFRSIGLGTAPAAEMSTTLVQLASDLASFNNANPEDVLLALRSGLVGEVEPLRKFGVSLSAARVESEALALGLVQPIGSLSKLTTAQVGAEKAQVAYAKAVQKFGPESLEARDASAKQAKAEEALAAAITGKVPPLNAAQKAQAAYSIIMKDTALAQGDFSRTADGAANKQRILTAQVKDLGASIGQKLLPIGQKLLGWVSSLLDGFDGLSPGVQNIVLGLVGLAAVAGPLTAVIGGLVTVIGFLISPVGLVILGIVALVAAVVLIWQNWDTIWNAIRDHPALAAITALFLPFIAMLIATVGAVKYVYENWAAIWAQIQVVAQTVWDAIKGYVLAGVQIVTGIVNFGLAIIQGRWGAAWNAMVQVLGGIWAFIKQAVSDGVTQTINLVASIPGAIMRIASGFGGLLVGAGRALMEGLLNGIKQAWHEVENFLGGLADKITSLKGPPVHDATVLVNNGQLLMQGLRRGMEQEWTRTAAFLGGLTPTIGATVAVSPGAGGAGMTGGGGGGARGGGVFNQTNNITVVSPDPEAVVTAIKAYERRNGRAFSN